MSNSEKEIDLDFTKKQLLLIKEADNILAKLGKSGVGIVAIDGGFYYFNTNVWDIDGIDLDCGAYGFQANGFSFNDHKISITKKIECQH